MFTGIIQAVGSVAATQVCDGDGDGDLRLEIDIAGLAESARKPILGDSIAVNGVCLTVIEIRECVLAFDVSVESLDRTLLGDLEQADRVNLEAALTSAEVLGGHLVSGHVDGVAEVLSLQSDARSTRMTFLAPSELGRFIAEKGSVCIDGVSLTVNDITDTESGTEFGVNAVPHTLENTNFKDYVVGTSVHLEIDQIARYIDRILRYKS